MKKFNTENRDTAQTNDRPRLMEIQQSELALAKGGADPGSGYDAGHVAGDWIRYASHYWFGTDY